MTIVVVDDEPDFADLVAFGLRRRGHRVVIGCNGLEGLDHARRLLPDLIIMDLMMPGLDGYSTCEILRSQPSTKSIPIVILTAMTGDIPRLNGLATGANRFFTKMTPMQELLDQIDLLAQSKEEKRQEFAMPLEKDRYYDKSSV